MSTMEHADRFLVARMLQGDEAAFKEFFDRSSRPLYRFALPRVNGDADAAEEIVTALSYRIENDTLIVSRRRR